MKLLITTAFLFVSALPALGASLTLFYVSGTFNVGDSLTVGVVLSPGADTIFAYQTDLLFNPTQLNFVDATEDGFFIANGTGASWDTPDNVNGSVTNILDTVSGQDGLNFEDHVLNLEFLVTGAGTGLVALRNEFAADDNFSSLPVDRTVPLFVQTQDAPATSPEPATFLGVAPALAAGFFLRKRLTWRKS